MPTYNVFPINAPADVEPIYSYQADAPIEWVGYEFASYRHVLEPQTQVQAAPATRYGGRRWLTRVEFVALLGGMPVYVSILAMARQSVEVEAFVRLIEMTTPDPVTGYSVNLDDPLMTNLNTLESALVAQGVVQAGWAQGVVNG